MARVGVIGDGWLEGLSEPLLNLRVADILGRQHRPDERLGRGIGPHLVQGEGPHHDWRNPPLMISTNYATTSQAPPLQIPDSGDVVGEVLLLFLLRATGPLEFLLNRGLACVEGKGSALVALNIEPRGVPPLVVSLGEGYGHVLLPSFTASAAKVDIGAPNRGGLVNVPHLPLDE